MRRIESLLRKVKARLHRIDVGAGTRIGSGVSLSGKGISIGDHCELLGPMSIETLSHKSGDRVLIGPRVKIKPHSWLNAYGGSIDIGEDSLIGFGCVLFGHGGIEIGQRTLLSPYVVAVASEHAYWMQGPLPARGFTRELIKIGSDVWIGSHATILAGSVIGDNCVIGAGSVVHGKLESGFVYIGSPAKAVSKTQDISRIEHRPAERWPGIV